MEVKDLGWNDTTHKRCNNPLLLKSIRGLIIGKSGCDKTTVTEPIVKTRLAGLQPCTGVWKVSVPARISDSQESLRREVTERKGHRVI